MERVIFHVDVNSAFLSWSALKKLREEPGSVDLREIPSAVGGDVATRHGIITAKSIPAKKYGIVTGEPVVKALQKCPNLVLVHSDFKVYREYSHALMGILREYSDKVEQASIDEAYLDLTDRLPSVTHSCSGKDGFYETDIPGESLRAAEMTHSSAEPLRTASEIRDRVFRELGFTVNVGVASNKLLAKMASDFKKPGRVHTLWPEEIGAKMWPLPIGELFGCGGKTAARLNSLGIRTIGDAAATDEAVLVSFLGEMSGRYIHAAALGNSDSEVSGEREDAKSYSNETTVRSDITAESFDSEALPVVRRLAGSVSGRLKRDGFYAGTIDVSVKTDDFHRFSRQTGIDEPTNDERTIYETSVRLLRELMYGDEKRPGGLFGTGRTIRLIGVGGTGLDRGDYRQIDLFSLGLGAPPEPEIAPEPEVAPGPEAVPEPEAAPEPEVMPDRSADKKEKARRMLEEIQARFGRAAVTKGAANTNSDRKN